VSERTSEQVSHEPADEEPKRERELPNGSLIALLVLDGVLLGVFGLVFTPLYTNGIPVPMGAVLSFLVLPWLVARTGEIDPRPAVAGAPLTAWAVTIGVLVLFGPGGDDMLLIGWPALGLVAALLAGLWSLRAAVERGYRRSSG
jgi:hypothetical protein